MKRFLSVALALCLVLAVAPYVLAVSTENTISCGEAYVSDGGTVCVPIQIANNTGFMGFSIRIGYNANAMVPISVSAGEILSTGSINDSIGIDAPGSFKTVWTNSENVYADGVLFIVTFRVLDNASECENITLSYHQGDTFNEAWQDVVFHCINGSIPTNITSLPTNTNTVISTPSEIMAGEQFDLPVRFDSLTELMGFNIVITYDSSVFSPVSVTRGSDFSSGAMNNNIEMSCGSLKVVWTGTENVATDGNAFVVRFATQEFADAGQYTFDISYVQADTFNEAWQDVVLNCQGASITVKRHHENYIYSLENSAQASELVSIPVAIKNNCGFMGFGMKITYDESVFEPVSVSAGEILSNGTLNDSIDVSPKGSFRVVYTASSNAYSDGILFTITLAVNKNASGGSVIDLSYIQADTFNENWADVVLFCEDVPVEIENSSHNNTPRFYSTPISSQAGSKMTVPIILDNNGSMTSFSLTVDYNASIFTPVSVTNGEVVIGEVTHNISAASTGSLTVAWNGEVPITHDGVVVNIVFSIKEYVQAESVIMMVCDYATFTGGNAEDVLCEKITVNVSNPYANEPIQLYSDTVTAVAGQIVSIPVSIRNNHGLMGFGITVSYDASVLTPLSVTKGNVINNGTLENSIDVATPGNFKLIWSGNEDTDEEGLLFILQFVVDPNPGTDLVTVSLKSSSYDTFNENWDSVPLECNDLMITISVSGDADEDGAVTLQDVVLITRWLAGGWNVTINETNSDVNRDGEINLKDAVLIRRFLAGGWNVVLR